MTIDQQALLFERLFTAFGWSMICLVAITLISMIIYIQVDKWLSTKAPQRWRCAYLKSKHSPFTPYSFRVAIIMWHRDPMKMRYLRDCADGNCSKYNIVMNDCGQIIDINPKL
jgi:hypothetical protein